MSDTERMEAISYKPQRFYPRTKGCEYGVFEGPMNDVVPCGETAVAYWVFNPSCPEEKLYVCEHHDEAVEKDCGSYDNLPEPKG